MNLSLKIIVFKIIPARLLSRLFGRIAVIPFPQLFLKRLINWFVKKFDVALEEAHIPPGGYRTFDEFFTRTLKKGMRSVNPDIYALTSPVDAVASACGNIEYGQIVQAKGITYDAASLVPGQMQSTFVGGSFITLYLSPRDYHRIHSPVSGVITGWQYDPGRLYTVQEWLVNALPGLFAVNERITTYIDSRFGMVAVCKVGAMNVGRITLSYAPEYTNKCCASPHYRAMDSDEQIKIHKGDELGIFHLGSTVIVLTEKRCDFLPDMEGSKVKMGQAVAYF